MTATDLQAVWLTALLAGTTTLLLMPLATPLAWWLVRSSSPARPMVEAVVALPLVLPPTVLGFYLLVILNPTAPVGAFWISITGQSLTFSFSGLVLASILYSLPFMVQPLATAFRSVPQETLEAAATLGASPWDQLISLVLPAARRGFLTGSVLTFAHTVGEFGVVLMMGGNIPGETRVLSIAIYEHVETLNYDAAHAMALGLLLFSFVSLWAVYRLASQRVEVIRG
ncbi:molybdate ABC transporter permease subunit [Luminiphilus sp.]|nr:molybdate ABC transporter permease subunit [Luminiphilus sp.]MDA9711475.1 molybdate ABC transporter permease subunit [Luminiphilus sp.]